MTNCTISNGHYSGLKLDNSTGANTISNSTFQNNGDYGIYIYGSRLVLQGNTSTGNGYGVYIGRTIPSAETATHLPATP